MWKAWGDGLETCFLPYWRAGREQDTEGCLLLLLLWKTRSLKRMKVLTPMGCSVTTPSPLLPLATTTHWGSKGKAMCVETIAEDAEGTKRETGWKAAVPLVVPVRHFHLLRWLYVVAPGSV